MGCKAVGIPCRSWSKARQLHILVTASSLTRLQPASRSNDRNDNERHDSGKCRAEWPVESRAKLAVNDAAKSEAALATHHLWRQKIANCQNEDERSGSHNAGHAQWYDDA